MSLFGNIVDKIVSYAETAVGAAPAKAATPVSSAAASNEGNEIGAAASATTPAAASAEAPTASGGGATASLQSIDIGAVLESRAATKGEALHWQTSIVDLLKVLDLDSSLDARKRLAAELDVHAGADGTAEENEALHKAVVAKLEANGGQVPTAMKG